MDLEESKLAAVQPDGVARPKDKYGGDGVTRVSILTRFDPKLADAFVFKSISEETWRTYREAIKDFFTFVNGVPPSDVNPPCDRIP